MRLIRFLWQVSWRNILIATIVGLISGSGNAMLIILINRSVHQASFPRALLYFVIFAISILLTSTASQFLLINISQNALYQLRLKLSQNILSSPLNHLEKLGENRLLVALNEDIRGLSHSLSAIPSICIDIATVIGCLIYLAWLSGTIFALTIAASSLSIWYVQSRLGKAQNLFRTAREEEDSLLKHFQAIIKGIKELKLNRLRRAEFSANYLRNSAAKLRQKNSVAMKSFAVASGLGQLTQYTILGFILFILPGFMHIPLEMLSSYILITTFLGLPLQNILNRIPDLLRANVALQKIEMMELSLARDTEIQTICSQEVGEFCKLELVQVVYRYPPEEEIFPLSGHPPHPHFPPPNSRNGYPTKLLVSGFDTERENGFFSPGVSPNGIEQGFVLGPISLSLQPGQITFVVGGNGSGKSTLAKLITGLYVPYSGSIYLNRVLISEQEQEWYRQHFSAIFTDFYLFEHCLGLNHPDLDREVEGYLKQLQLDHKVKVKNGTLSTINLSQGQRKRLALLTAYLEDCPIYVFDEWASDQEPLFRELFYREILVKLKERGKAVLVITHDDRYFYLADQLIKLDYGKIG